MADESWDAEGIRAASVPANVACEDELRYASRGRSSTGGTPIFERSEVVAALRKPFGYCDGGDDADALDAMEKGHGKAQ